MQKYDGYDGDGGEKTGDVRDVNAEHAQKVGSTQNGFCLH